MCSRHSVMLYSLVLIQFPTARYTEHAVRVWGMFLWTEKCSQTLGHSICFRWGSIWNFQNYFWWNCIFFKTVLKQSNESLWIVITSTTLARFEWPMPQIKVTAPLLLRSHGTNCKKALQKYLVSLCFPIILEFLLSAVSCIILFDT